MSIQVRHTGQNTEANFIEKDDTLVYMQIMLKRTQKSLVYKINYRCKMVKKLKSGQKSDREGRGFEFTSNTTQRTCVGVRQSHFNKMEFMKRRPKNYKIHTIYQLN